MQFKPFELTPDFSRQWPLCCSRLLWPMKTLWVCLIIFLVLKELRISRGDFKRTVILHEVQVFQLKWTKRILRVWALQQVGNEHLFLDCARASVLICAAFLLLTIPLLPQWYLCHFSTYQILLEVIHLMPEFSLKHMVAIFRLKWLGHSLQILE